MSRVRDAMKRANAMQEAPTQALSILEEDNPGPARSFEAVGTQPHSAEPGSVVRATFSSDQDRKAGAEPEDFKSSPPAQAKSGGLKAHPLLRQRWVRRMLKFAGLRMAAPVPNCHGLTRLGQPCHGPAMANGFCRLHGGSRSGVVAERTRSPLERISPTR